MKLTMPRVVVFLNMHTKFREKLGKIVSSSFLHSIVATILCRNDEETIFPSFSRNFVCILRKTTTRGMVSFIDFYVHFLANFQT